MTSASEKILEHDSRTSTRKFQPFLASRLRCLLRAHLHDGPTMDETHLEVLEARIVELAVSGIRVNGLMRPIPRQFTSKIKARVTKEQWLQHKRRVRFYQSHPAVGDFVTHQK